MALLSARLNIGRLNAERLHFIGLDTTPPTPPTNLTATAVPGYVDLAWTAATDYYGIGAYAVYRCSGANCTNWKALTALPGSSTTYRDTTAQPDTTYRYLVQTSDWTGHLSNSAPVTVTTGPALFIYLRPGATGNYLDIMRWCRVENASITQALNEVTDTATVKVSGTIPYALEGSEITICQADTSRIFSGHITAVRTVYEGKAKNIAYECDCLDYTWLLTSKKITKRYVGWSISTIFTDLLTTFAPGFAINVSALSNNVVLDEITFTNEELSQAFSRVCERGGAYWYVDYTKYVWLFNAGGLASAGTIDQAHCHTVNKLQKHKDYVPVITQVIARGGGASASADIPVGSTSLLIDDPAWYGGGHLVECGPQRISYSNVIAGTTQGAGTGALVGTGNAPSSGPAVTSQAGTNLTQGATYKYAVSFVTAAGESLPGGITSYYAAGGSILPMPPPNVEVDYYAGSQLVGNGTYRFALEAQIRGGGRVGGQPSAPIFVPMGSTGPGQAPKYIRVSWTSAHFTDPNITGLYVCRTTNGGGTFYVEPGGQSGAGYANSFSASGTPDGDIVQMGQMAGSGSALLSAALSAIPVSPSSAVTGRKIYRTTANGTQLKLLATLANNTATTFSDTITDAGLGANAPVIDGSGLKQEGVQAAGSTVILVSNATVFNAAGGWITVSGMTLRYTGISGSSLVLAAPLPSTLSYGSEVLNASYLTGIPASGAGSVVQAIGKGDEVYLMVIIQDAAAVAALAAAIGGDGIKEEFLTDGRLALEELTARAQALLAMRKSPLVTVTFESRDPAVVVGKTITFNTTSPAISGTFLIQRCTISQWPAKASVAYIPALRVVEASSRRFTFDDLVQQIKLLGRIN